MKMRLPCFGLLLAAVAGTAPAAGLPPCMGPVVPFAAQAIRVDTNGVLTLKDGRRAVLEGLRLPRSDEDGAQQARQALWGMIAGRQITLAVTPPKEDRHGRLRAQVFVNGEWAQETLLREGVARVELLPVHPQCATQLYAAEAAARAAKRGLWAFGSYAVRSPDDLAHARGTFQIVEGRVVGAALKGGRAYLNFSDDWKHDFTVTISPEDMKAFKKAKVDPRDYAGKTIRVRGIIDWYRGPEIELMGPESVEVVE
jgi:hypothetical protein